MRDKINLFMASSWRPRSMHASLARIVARLAAERSVHT